MSVLSLAALSRSVIANRITSSFSSSSSKISECITSEDDRIYRVRKPSILIVWVRTKTSKCNINYIRMFYIFEKLNQFSKNDLIASLISSLSFSSFLYPFKLIYSASSCTYCKNCLNVSI